MNLRELIFGKRFWMESPLSESECLERLKGETAPNMFVADNRSFISTIWENSVLLRRRAFLLKVYQTTLHAWLLKDEERTLLDCTYGLNRDIRIVLAIWVFLLTPAFGVLLLVSPPASFTSFGQIHKSTPLSLTLSFVAFTIIPLATAALAWFMGRHEEGHLVEFLEATINARRVSRLS